MIIKRKNIGVTLGQLKKLFQNEINILRRFAFSDWITKDLKPFDPYNYYCGITNNIEVRQNQHNAQFLGYVETFNVTAARIIEILMNYFGYDTGRRAGNGGKENSVYVYIYRKIPGVTIEIIP